jgi:hypothetical protein
VEFLNDSNSETGMTKMPKSPVEITRSGVYKIAGVAYRETRHTQENL